MRWQGFGRGRSQRYLGKEPGYGNSSERQRYADPEPVRDGSGHGTGYLTAEWFSERGDGFWPGDQVLTIEAVQTLQVGQARAQSAYYHGTDRSNARVAPRARKVTRAELAPRCSTGMAFWALRFTMGDTTPNARPSTTIITMTTTGLVWLLSKTYDRDRKYQCALHIESGRAWCANALQGRPRNHHSDEAERNVDQEDPSPRGVIDKEATGERPATLPMAKVPDMRQTYRPRWRGESTSPMMAKWWRPT